MSHVARGATLVCQWQYCSYSSCKVIQISFFMNEMIYPGIYSFLLNFRHYVHMHDCYQDFESLAKVVQWLTCSSSKHRVTGLIVCSCLG